MSTFEPKDWQTGEPITEGDLDRIEQAVAAQAAQAAQQQAELGGKASVGHTHDDRYYTEAETDGLIEGRSPVGHTHDDRYYTEAEVDSRIRDSRWARALNLDGSVPVENLESGLYPVANGSVAAALGLPTAQPGSVWVHRLGPDIGRMEWRPTRFTEVWGRRKHGTSWERWEIQGVRASVLTGADAVENLPTGLYQVSDVSVAAALGLPTGDSGSLWVHRLTPETGRMEWRPTRTLDVWQRRLHGSDGWQAWTLPAVPAPEPDPDPEPDPFEGAALTLQDTGHVMIPASIGVDGWLYGYNTTRTRPLRSGDSLDTAPIEGPPIHNWVPQEDRGRGIAHVERTSSGFVVIYEKSATAGSVWHSPAWEGPYTKTLDIGPWHFTSLAKSRLVAGSTWMLVGEYTNSIIPSITRRRWLSVDGGMSWKLVRSDVPVTTGVNNHCHTGLIRADGRIYVSDGDGPNNFFGYSDDQGASWVPVPTDPRIQNDSVPYSQPTVLIDFGGRIALSPDRGPYQPGMWTLDPNTQAQSIVWELAEGGPYNDASKQYGRSVFAQAGQVAYVMFPPGGSGNPNVYVAATPDGGRRWGVVATIPHGGASLNTGVYGPDRNGNLFMRGAGIPTYGGNVIRAKQLDWNV